MLVARSPNFIDAAGGEPQKPDNASYALRAALAWRLIARPAQEAPPMSMPPAPVSLPSIAA